MKNLGFFNDFGKTHVKNLGFLKVLEKKREKLEVFGGFEQKNVKKSRFLMIGKPRPKGGP